MAKSVTKFTQTDDTLSVRFDYETVDPEHREGLREDAREIRARLKETALSMMDIGERLVRSRPKLPHGAWLPWLLSETGMSESWSRGCIKLFRRFGDEAMLLEQLDVALPPTAILRLASAPDTALEDVKDHVSEGGKLGVAEVEALIKRHRDRENEPEDAAGETKPARKAEAVGAEALRWMAEAAHADLAGATEKRLAKLLHFIHDAEGRLTSGRKYSLAELQQVMRPKAQWLTEALEELTQCRAASSVKLLRETSLERGEHAPGAWAEVASFLRDISHSTGWEIIKAQNVPELLRRGRISLEAVLSRELHRDFTQY